METLPTPEETGRMVLRIFGHFGKQPSEALGYSKLITMCAEWHWQTSDVADGVDYGIDAGWLERDPKGSIKLTEAGYAEI